MNKLVYISLLSFLILYALCEEGKDGTGDGDGAGAGAGTQTTTASCDKHQLANGETCDKLKVTDSTKKKCVLKSGSTNVCTEVDKENAGEMLNIFKISFALLILFTIL